MSNDRREDILSRLYAILKTIKGVSVYRNVDEVPDAKRPYLMLIDGDEVRSDTAAGKNSQPVVMKMSPLILFGTSGTDVGPDVNALRAKVLPAIMTDATLQTTIGNNGRILYEGLTGRLSSGPLMASDMQLNLSIFYVLQISTLA